MSVNELLERRAERGLPRGAGRVWSDAHLASPTSDFDSRSGSTMLFRVAVAVWAIGFVAVGMTGLGSTGSSGAGSSQSTEDSIQADPDSIQSEEPLPAPLLIDGGTLKRDRGGVSRPFDPDFDGDDLFDGVFPSTPPPEIPADHPEPWATTVVFASETNPFDGPILGVELVDGGGFRPWGANMTDAELTDFTKHLERIDGEWSMTDDGGLIEVARLRGDRFDWLKFGWQFDFQLADNDEVTIQAETNEGDHIIDEWLWIARLADQGGTNATVRSVEVLGRDGLLIDNDDRSGDDGVVWEADGFVYRMTASRLEDNTSYGRDSTADIARLRVVDRSEWVDAIARSNQTSPRELGAGLLAMVILLGLALSTVYFLVRRSFQAAALATATLVAWVFLVGSPMSWGSIALTALGLGLAWSLHRRLSQASEPRTASPPAV